ncbi:disease resistance protein RPS5-like isoform X1 [Eucalyptus grandis]|uniref:disease resistance protein RPS5-like isoform X1 n=1 Tax=Eucalyptus grandis TaxID=71139 RepID=UPI00192F11AB|nr:disease resistance protein RPS5-like isoform X1 [Eucalyptus grandis]
MLPLLLSLPEDYPIVNNELIELWIGEGLLGDTNNVYRMREEGEYVLGDLKRLCLLESGLDDYQRQYVKMHDVIRDMAIWIARDYGQRENKLIVIEEEEDISAKMISKWGEAKKVSIWGEWIQNINQTPPRCFQLKTLIVRETNVMEVPRGFFESMAACLMVLDLSNNNNITSFPEGICNLISLRYLNLSHTCIRELPKEINNLTRLQWLLLDHMMEHILIPTGAITSLPLNVFSMWGLNLYKEEEMVEELGRMQGLTDLSIKVCESSSTLKIFQSFQRCIRRVHIESCEGLTHIPISHSLKGSGNFSHLEVLNFYDCRMLVKMEINQGIGQAPNCYCFPSLVEVLIINCGFLDLSWLVHAPKLQSLIVAQCNLMEKIIGDGIAREELAASGLFSRLKSLRIENLRKLRSICDHALLFPQGVKFSIFMCPGLKKLPLDSNGMRGSFSIIGDKGWWEEFEWDPAARVTFEGHGRGNKEEMTYGEAARKMKDDEYFNIARIGFLASGDE